LREGERTDLQDQQHFHPAVYHICELPRIICELPVDPEDERRREDRPAGSDWLFHPAEYHICELPRIICELPVDPEDERRREDRPAGSDWLFHLCCQVFQK
jgi:hypothetical protein